MIIDAHAGEPLDALVWRAIGSTAVEPVLEANPGIADLGAFLPEGTAVFVPAPAAESVSELPLIQLWD
jgi:phage tail protein X